MSKRDPVTVMRELEITYDTNLLDNKPDKDQDKYLNDSIMNRNSGKETKLLKNLHTIIILNINQLQIL